MDEIEWNRCADPWPMLEFLGGRVSVRKCRLLACACFRHTWRPFPREEYGRGAEIAERHADGLASDRELSENLLTPYRGDRPACDEAFEALIATGDYLNWPEYLIEKVGVDKSFIEAAEGQGEPIEHPNFVAALAAERTAQADFVRCLLGNPFHPPPAIDPSWRAWNGGIVVRLAQNAYEQRAMPAGTLDPAHLTVLADALEEAGCTDTELLAHLRSPGPHVRGCFALDAVLGKS